MCLGNLSLFRGNGLGKRFSESKKDLREQTGKKKRVIYFPLIYIYIYMYRKMEGKISREGK